MAKASSNNKTKSTAKRPPAKGAPTKSSSKKKTTAAAAPEPKEPAVPMMWVYAGIALLLGVLAFIGFFLQEGSNDGFLLRYFRSFLMGIIGYGYWAFPFAMAGFFHYNGMTFEQFLLAVIRSEFLYPKVLIYRAENLYVRLLENSSLKEVLRLD